jgi:hypothetical protein
MVITRFWGDGGNRNTFGLQEDYVSDQFRMLYNRELHTCNLHMPYNIYLFNHGLFTDTVNNSGYIVLKQS